MRLLILILTLTIVGLPASAAEYVVSLQGDDANDGSSWQTAFRTIQRGVDALAPGDTLTIGAGEYHEYVYRESLGDYQSDTVIRAERPGTVVLRGDVPGPTFAPVDGYRFVYVADWKQPVEAVFEQDTLTILERGTTIEGLEYQPGSCYLDTEAGKLYISTSDLQPPAHHHYTVSVTPKSGIRFDKAKRVILDGIVTTGFHNYEPQSHYPGNQTVWGILFGGSSGSTVRRCTAYLNGGGIATWSTRGDGQEGGNLIEDCTAFANYSRYCGEGGNIMSFSSNNDTIRGVYAYLGSPNNIRHYGSGIRGPAILEDSLAWGASYADIFLKGGQVGTYGLTTGTIALGILHSANIEHSIIGTKNQYNDSPSMTNLNLYRQARSDEQQREAFADPDNFDFRLQATSTFRRAGPRGVDSGPTPYQTNVLYVKPDGDDSANGLSMQHAWQTLAHAFRQLRPGDTLYLAPGTYQAAPLPVGSIDDMTTSIRGRGPEPIVIEGEWELSESANLSFERLAFTGQLTLRNLRNLSFVNCRFANGLDVARVEALALRHCEFAGSMPALRLFRCEDVELAGNIFANHDGPALRLARLETIAYSDYNAYAQETAWQVGKQLILLAETGHERYSRLIPPAYEQQDGVPMLTNQPRFRTGGPRGTWLGYYRENYDRKLSIAGPFLHSVSDTTANIEWYTARPAEVTIAWGPTPDCEHRVTVETKAFGTHSLTGLEPGQTYYVRIATAEEPMGSMLNPPLTEPGTTDGPPLKLQTAAKAAEPVTWYVATDGDDTNSGRSRDQAFRTIAHAADQVNAGDTVRIAGGTYSEAIRLRASGAPGRPITFTTVPGEQVIIDGDSRRITTAFQINGKSHIVIDGFYFYGQGHGGWDSVVNVFHSQHITVSRCFMNGRRGGSGMAPQILRTDTCDYVTMRNCVIASGFQGAYFRRTDHLLLEHNVFLRNLICAFLNSGGVEGGIVSQYNIFGDTQPYKAKVHLFELGGIEQYIFRDNCFFLRLPDEERKPLLFYGYGPKRLSVEEYEARYGPYSNVVVDPVFQRTLAEQPVDRHGNPYEFAPDWLFNAPELDFPDLFTTNADLQERGIGLQPEAFADFHFNRQEDAP